LRSNLFSTHRPMALPGSVDKIARMNLVWGENIMDDLIKALQIFRKYNDTKYPTGCACEHGVMYINVEFDKVSKEDIEALEALSFIKSKYDIFESYRFGSC